MRSSARDLLARMPGVSALIPALALLGACGGTGPATPIPPPVVALTAPNCSGVVLKPTTYELAGTIDGPYESATFQIQGPAGTSAVAATISEDGVATGSYTFERSGSYQIVLQVDYGLDTTQTEATSCAVSNQTPTVRISSPDNASSFTEEETITLVAQVGDDDDASTDLSVEWSSASDGDLGTVMADATGVATLEVSGLSALNHLLTARVSDPWGGAAEAVVTIEVTECEDKDEDGVSECTDCDDRDPEVNPAALEVCDGKDNDCNEAIDELGDADGDLSPQCVPGCAEGASCVLDCNDQDAAVKPGATEVCDTKDNNCNQQVDEGFDNDQDSFSSCTLQTDCDDSNPNAYPGAPELCDTRDNDCDSATDEGLSTTYYRDSDRDTYGDPANSLSVCTPGQPPGYVANADDCDDDANTVYPGASELCDGLDNNCDSSVDEGQTLSTFYTDLDNDGYGDPNAPVQGCVAPVGTRANSDDCDDTLATVYPNAPETCDGVDQDCDRDIDEGVLTTFYADPDGDTYGDPASTQLACSAPSGYVAQAGDCGPADGETYPGASEGCDVVDNDCDGTMDEGAAETFYKDGDGDGYGRDNDTVSTCSPPAGYVALGGDCADGQPAINPGAVEICDGKDQDCDGTSDEGVKTTYYKDADGDGIGTPTDTAQACSVPSGYSPASGDCDDTHADAYPGATELCDGRDNDCNGELDNGLTTRTYYIDADGDTYGDAATTVQACATPPGYASRSGDCKDGNAAIYPGATEVCNAKDDNCDNVIDEGVKNTYYKDVDADSYGDAAEPRQACTLCQGCSANDDDCDDTDPLTFPGAPERFDGEDNNCDDLVEREMGLGVAHATFGGTAAGAWTGASIDGLGDFDGDQIDDFAFGAPRLANKSGAVYIVYGKTAGWGNVAASGVDAVLSNATADIEAGTAVTGGDIDNDGTSDLLIGIPKYNAINGTAPSGGHVALFYGGGRIGSGDILDTEDNRVEGYFPQVNMGFALDASGDVTCDGINDVLIAAPWSWTAQVPNPGGGAVFILPGKNSQYNGPGGVGGGELIQIYGANNDLLGKDVAFVDDMGGSICGDFVASAAGKSGMGPQAISDMGRTYLIGGADSSGLPLSELLEAPDLDLATWDGTEANDMLGKSLAGLGDIDGDGFGDFAAGRAVNGVGEALAVVFLGGADLPTSGNGETRSNVSVVSNAGLRCPCVVGDLGDINGDGLYDWAVSVPGSSSGGTIFVFLGDEAGYARTLTAETSADFIFTAETTGDEAGISIAGVGDVNGDGADDFAIGAQSADGQVGSAGKVYLFFGF